jgi:hypothetical protein
VMVSCLVHVPTLHWHHHEPVRLLSNIDGLLLLKEAPEVTGEVGAEVDARWGLPAESCPVRICAGWCTVVQNGEARTSGRQCRGAATAHMQLELEHPDST